jgi:DNA-binding MarR family transcriptional regulator
MPRICDYVGAITESWNRFRMDRSGHDSRSAERQACLSGVLGTAVPSARAGILAPSDVFRLAAYSYTMQLLSRTTENVAAPQDCAAALLDALPGVVWFVRRQMRSRRAEGLSVPQFRTLVQLQRCPEASLYELAEKLGSSLPTLSRIVSGLVVHGWVERKSCTRDRRRVSLQLTARGRATLDAAWTGTQAAIAERLSGLAEADRVTLARALALISELFACTIPCAREPSNEESPLPKSRPQKSPHQVN